MTCSVSGMRHQQSAARTPHSGDLWVFSRLANLATKLQAPVAVPDLKSVSVSALLNSLGTRLFLNPRREDTAAAAARDECSLIPAELPPGSLVQVQTRSRTYTIECLNGSTIRIAGHPDYCPFPTSAEMFGALDLEGACSTGRIITGQNMVVYLRNQKRPMMTSRVVSFQILNQTAEDFSRRQDRPGPV